MKNYILISKDAMCKEYLPTYGNTIWNTPNINELANEGTVFENHYTAAPSTVMSFFSMITGKYCHETEYQLYEKINDKYREDTLFSKLKQKGYDCHIIWGDIWMVLPKYFDCYRDDVTIHEMKEFRQGVGAHYIHEGFLKSNDEKKKATIERLENLIREITNGKENVFLWVHFPHVINGEVSYGSDIELFDKCIGIIRKYFSNDCIAITADHGNMNGHKGKICYGYDVYQPSINIPLITPRIEGKLKCSQITTSIDLYNILFEKKIVERKIVFSDTAFRAQRHRKICIIYENYKYIYNKIDKSEELYDIEYDSNEDFNLIDDYVFDVDRKISAPSRELYFYPKWENITKIRNLLRNEKNIVWKRGNPIIAIKSKLKDILRTLYVKIRKHKI